MELVMCSLVMFGVSMGLFAGALCRTEGLRLATNAIVGGLGALVGYADYHLLGYTLDQLGRLLTFSLVFVIFHLLVAHFVFRATQ